MLAPQTILQDRYLILRQLGQGGMGAVYEAVDQRLDTTVALKETLFTEEKLRRQFEREARLLARLHHPALPRVSDHFAEADGEFLVMQYIAGEDLAEMINLRRGPFPVEQVLLWADQLLDALDYLHTQDPQIIHRDIKPQNLKLSGRGQIILLDFGLAKGQVGEVSRVSSTASASIFGYTPNYAPLEQIQGLGTDARSDIYSLAATLYHLLTGVKPPDALTRAAAIVNGQPDPLLPANQVNPSIGAPVALALQRGLAQNREQRYTTAAAMRNALHSSSETTVGGAQEAATVLFPPRVDIPTKLVSASPTVPGAITSTGETTVVKPQPPPRNGLMKWGLAGGGLILLLCAGGAGFFYMKEKGNNAPATSVTTPQSEPVNSISVGQPSPASSPATEEKSAAKTEPAKQVAATKETHNKPESTKQDRAAEEAKRVEAERRQEQEDARRQAAEQAEAERRAQAEKEREKENKKQPEPPDTPDYVEVPGPNGRGRRRIPTVRNRTLPDGTRILITPNGTRVVTLPDGTTKVLPPPGQRRRQRP